MWQIKLETWTWNSCCQAASECVKLNLKPDSAACWSGGKQHFSFCQRTKIWIENILLQIDIDNLNLVVSLNVPYQHSKCKHKNTGQNIFYIIYGWCRCLFDCLSCSFTIRQWVCVVFAESSSIYTVKLDWIFLCVTDEEDVSLYLEIWMIMRL